MEVPNISFDQIFDLLTGRYNVTYERLGFRCKEEYTNCGGDVDKPYTFHHHFCSNLEPAVERQSRLRHGHCNITLETNFNLLLGDEPVLEALRWICDAIMRDGGISIGCLVEKGTTSNSRMLVLTDSNSEQNPFVFTQFRPITKHVRGDTKEKRLITLSPFDI